VANKSKKKHYQTAEKKEVKNHVPPEIGQQKEEPNS
jgi:hypothetical protein